MWGQKLSRLDVAEILDDFIVGSGGLSDWDNFISFSIEDEHLEEIRRRCAQLDEEFPPEQKGHYCSQAGIAVIRAYVAELRSP